jgi:hypothetical protein
VSAIAFAGRACVRNGNGKECSMDNLSTEAAKQALQPLGDILKKIAGCPILDVVCQGWDSTAASIRGFRLTAPPSRAVFHHTQPVTAITYHQPSLAR